MSVVKPLLYPPGLQPEDEVIRLTRAQRARMKRRQCYFRAGVRVNLHEVQHERAAGKIALAVNQYKIMLLEQQIQELQNILKESPCVTDCAALVEKREEHLDVAEVNPEVVEGSTSTAQPLCEEQQIQLLNLLKESPNVTDCAAHEDEREDQPCEDKYPIVSLVVSTLQRKIRTKLIRELKKSVDAGSDDDEDADEACTQAIGPLHMELMKYISADDVEAWVMRISSEFWDETRASMRLF